MGSMKLLALLVVFGVCLAQGEERLGGGEVLGKIQKFFQDRNVCREQFGTRKVFEGFYTLIKLKCEWHAFVDTSDDASRAALVQDTDTRRRPQRPSTALEIYEIEFYPGQKIGPKYKTISSKNFKGINLRSLKLSGLNIERIDDDAFDVASNGKYLQSLDLSRNSLKRIDSHALANLKSIQHLNLSSNRLTFGENNFEHNVHLRTLDLSNNDLQFISPKTLSHLNSLEWLSLAHNHLKKVDACTFASVQVSTISSKYSPVYIDLNENPIDCDCQLFYLNRHLNYRLNATCNSPAYYKGKRFDQLKREDPAYRCNYEGMHAKCHPQSQLSDRDFYFVVIAASTIAVLLLVTCCCCCNSIAQSGKTMQAKSALADAKRAHAAALKNAYVHVVPPVGDYKDRERLIVHDK